MLCMPSWKLLDLAWVLSLYHSYGRFNHSGVKAGLFHACCFSPNMGPANGLTQQMPGQKSGPLPGLFSLGIPRPALFRVQGTIYSAED